jgi:hypothetical protein
VGAGWGVMQAEEEIMQLALALSASEVVKTPEELRAEARLNEKCEQAGFEKVPIYGDGNCLFQSVATLLGGGGASECSSSWWRRPSRTPPAPPATTRCRSGCGTTPTHTARTMTPYGLAPRPLLSIG